MKKIFLIPLLAVANFAMVAESLAQAPVIDREPYRKLYDINGDLSGVEFPDSNVAAHHPPPKFNFPTLLRTDASSLVNAEGIIHLAIDVTGDNLTYQWKKGNANLANMNDGTRVIDGANGPELRIFPVTMADFGIYRCVVSNSSGSVTSAPVRITVLDVFTTSTQMRATSRTAAVTLSASATVPTTGGAKYQWWKMTGAGVDPLSDIELSDGGLFSGTKKNALKIKVPDASVAGTYYCVVTSYGTFMYTGIRSVIVIPTPDSRLVQLGSPLQFEVLPAGPASLLGELEFSWNKEGAPLPGEESSTLTFASASMTDEGNYTVTVTHPEAGIVESGVATATVINSDVNTSFTLASQGKNGAFSVPVFNKAQTFQWYKGGVPLVENAKFKGVNKAKFTVNKAVPADAGEYECRTQVGGDEVVLARQVLIVVPAPESKVVALGDVLELEALHAYGGAAAVDEMNFSYQWFKGKNILPGETDKILSFDPVQMTDFGAYACLISYDGGTPVLSLATSVTTVDPVARVVNVNAGKKATLSFKKPFVLKGKDALFRWTREGDPLSDDLKYAGTAKDALVINNAALSDAGQYECEIYYSGGSSMTVPIDVVVFSAPEVLDLDFDPAIVGGFYSYAIETSPDPLYVPESFAAKPLPSGLKIDKLTGVIEGTPTVSGTFDVVVSVKNKVGTTVQTSQLIVSALSDHLAGAFAGPLPRSDPGDFGDRGGRFDMVVNSKGTASGKVLVGAQSWSFAGPISVIGTDPNTATAAAQFTGRLKGQPDLNIELVIGDNNRITLGEVSNGIDDPIVFLGWRNTTPDAGLAGLYNLGVGITTDDVGDDAIPQGTGYASFNLQGDGRLTVAGATADDEKITSASFVGPDGEVFFYQALYKTVEKGSILGQAQIDGSTAGNPLFGVGSWSRPENPSATHRRYKDGFGPVHLEIAGGAYVPGGSLLGATDGDLTFDHGGLNLASRNPNASFAISPGGTLPVRSSTGPDSALTVFNGMSLAAGLFNGTFYLAADIDPTTNKEYKRSVKFKGLVVPSGGELVGFGFFVAPQIPTIAPPTTTKTSPELSGSVVFEKTAP